jgi:hypothetical protein
MSENAPPPGSDPDPTPKPSGMPREDKIALGVVLAAVCIVVLGLIWAVSATFGLFGVAISAAETGFGFRDAFLVSVPISLAVILLFALVAGDGLVGELGVMLIGFFVILIFSAGAIAMLF